MNIKTIIKNVVSAILMTPVLIIALILYVPYALCRGLTDDFYY